MKGQVRRESPACLRASSTGWPCSCRRSIAQQTMRVATPRRSARSVPDTKQQTGSPTAGKTKDVVAATGRCGRAVAGDRTDRGGRWEGAAELVVEGGVGGRRLDLGGPGRAVGAAASAGGEPGSVRQCVNSARRSAGSPARDAASRSYGWSGPSARAAEVAKPPRMTSGVTQAGSPAAGVREPMVRRPSAIPACQRSARRRVSASPWVSDVRGAWASRPCG